MDRGFNVTTSKFECIALCDPKQYRDTITLYSGIRYKSYVPFEPKISSFMLSIQWISKALFNKTLCSQSLQKIAPNLGVLYFPTKWINPEIAKFKAHYLGKVEAINGATARVICRDYVRRQVPLSDLILEASSEALRRYDLTVGTDHNRNSIHRQLLIMSRSLTNRGRRNKSVFKDRLKAIQNLLGIQFREQLAIPLDSYQSGTVTIDASPRRVELPS